MRKIMLFLTLLIALLAGVGWSSPDRIQQTISNPIPVRFAKITNVNLSCVVSCSEMGISGQNLGATRGTKKLLIDGVPVSDAAYLAWQNDWIDLDTSKLPTLIPYDHVYQFSIVQGSTRISNVLMLRLPIKIQLGSDAGLAGSRLTFCAFGLRLPLGDKVIKLGTYTITEIVESIGCSGTGFNHCDLTVRVPAAPSGTYSVFVQRGGVAISTKVNFRVTLPVPPLVPLQKRK